MKHLFLCALLLHAWVANGQHTISGTLSDASSGEPLLAGTVLDLNSGGGATSNAFGFYSLTLNGNEARLRYSYIGYRDLDTTITLTEDFVLDIALSASVDLEVIEVTSDRQERIERKTQMSQMEIPVEQIKKLPALLGEVDVLKALQLLPGVQSGGEGTAGLYVRGGSPDQNLVLLDGVPVYNVSHVLGVFSVFNADALRNVTLTKGGFPARYGGRLSSVLEINMKEGNLKKWRAEGSAGIISSKLTVSGPIVKDKTSILLSGRRTYADLIARPLVKAQALEDEEFDINLHFYDLNAKVQHKVNEDHRLFLSLYKGADVFGTELEDSFGSYGGGTDWGNVISAARWNWRIGPKLFLNTTATYSKYNIDIESFTREDSTRFDALYRSGIEDVGAKVDFDYIPNPRHYVRFGGAYTNHAYSPGALTVRDSPDGVEENEMVFGNGNASSNEAYVYAEDDFSIGALKVNAGLHFSLFNTQGKTYTSLQPRLGLRYLVKDDLSLKASYSKMQQYVNLLTSESLSLPTDLWVPSTANIRPQNSWQVAIGAAKTYKEKYEFSVEAFYKDMSGVVSYKEGASFLDNINSNWENQVTQGDGEAYGAEFLLQRKRGRFTGWVGYTLSWNWRQFDEINGGRRFPFRYDRRHDLSVVANYDLTKKTQFSAAFVYGTGNAVSLPTYQYGTGSNDFRSTNNSWLGGYTNNIENGVDKNAFRMTNYHRLDVSVRFSKPKKWGERAWVVGIYNAYWHANPYFLTVREDFEFDQSTGNYENTRSIREISVLPLIPSVSYQFKIY